MCLVQSYCNNSSFSCYRFRGFRVLGVYSTRILVRKRRRQLQGRMRYVLLDYILARILDLEIFGVLSNLVGFVAG